MFPWAVILASILLLPIRPIPGIGTITGGSGGASDPQRSAVSIESPRAVAVDKEGNLYVADQAQHRVLRLDRAGRLGIVAGTGKEGFGGDGGPATEASLANPTGLALDAAGNLFIADMRNQRVRRVDAKTGIISTVAGNGRQGFSGDGGPADQASLFLPGGVAVDRSANLFIADMRNYCVRRVDMVSGTISTVAGNGRYGYKGDGGPAVEARLGFVSSLTLDKAGNLYIVDDNNHRVRRVDATTHVITTVAGDGGRCYRGDGTLARSSGLLDPSSVAFDAHNDLYIADVSWNRIYRVDSTTGVITAVAGNGLERFAADGGPAINASLAAPTGIALDSSGNLYIADLANHRVRRIDARTGVVSTVLGNENEGFPGDLIATDEEMKPFAPFFLKFSKHLNRFKVIKQHRISPEYSVTLIEGSAAREDVLCQGEEIEYSKRSADGIFVTSDGGKKLALVLDVFRGPWRSGLKILQADERTLILSKQDDTYGGESERVKYFYDLPTRKLINKISYHAMNVYSMADFQGSLFFVGSADRGTSILTIAKRTGDGTITGTDILREIEGERISSVLGVRKDGNSLVLSSEGRDYVLSEDSWIVLPRPSRDFHELKTYVEAVPGFGPIQRLVDAIWLKEMIIELDSDEGFLVCAYPLFDTTMNPDIHSGVYEIGAGKARFHALPQPDYDTFQRYRPVRTTQGYTRENATVEEGIGPFQLVGDKVWFGMSFYDGEGLSGVGGLGHFDISTGQFHVHYYPEIADWSASAILVENRYIWLGLVRRPEGAPYPGGLARYDRQQGTFRIIKIPAIVNKILRVGEVLYLPTTEGIYFLKGDELTHLDFVVDVNGKYALEAKSAPVSFAH